MTTENVPGKQTQDLKQQVLTLVSRFREACDNEFEETKQREKRLQPLIHALTHGIFRIVVMGEVKKGKTSFINALLGIGNLLPTATDVATSIVFKLLYGPVEKLTVFFLPLDDKSDACPPPIEIPRDRLAEFGTENGNPGNAKGVDFIAVEIPSPLLAEGIVLIDTPGVGGLFRKHRDISFGYAPNANAIFFVLDSIESVIGKDEINFLRELAKTTSHILFLQTKTDAAGEEQCQAWRRRNLEVLAQTLGIPANQIPYFLISSKLKGIADAQRSNEYLKDSGFPAVVKFLQQVLIPRRDAILARQLARALAAEVAAEGQIITEKLAIAQESSKPALEQYKAQLQKSQQEYQEWMRVTWPKHVRTYQRAASQIKREKAIAIEDELSADGTMFRAIIDEARKNYTNPKQLAEASESLLSEYAANCNRRANAIMDDFVSQVRQAYENLASTSAKELSQIQVPQLEVGTGAIRRDNTGQLDAIRNALMNYNVIGGLAGRTASVVAGAAAVAAWVGLISNPIGWTIAATAGVTALATRIWSAVRGYKSFRERQIETGLLSLEQAMRAVSARALRGAGRLLAELATDLENRAQDGIEGFQAAIGSRFASQQKEIQEAETRTAAEVHAAVVKLTDRLKALVAVAQSLQPIAPEPATPG